MLKHIALCKHGLDPEPYHWHAHLLGVWDTYPSSIVARPPRVAPTSGSADSADAAELPPTAAVGGLLRLPTVAELVFFRDAFWRGVESDVARAGSSIMRASSLIGRGYS